jgi:hypothetical protein
MDQHNKKIVDAMKTIKETGTKGKPNNPPFKSRLRGKKGPNGAYGSQGCKSLP